MRKGGIRQKNVFNRPLIFRNPFRSVGVRQRASRVMVAPIVRNGITSVENTEKMRALARMQELSNAGMLDQSGVNMSEFTGNTAVLPQGVTNVDNLQQQSDIARQIERYNAGILDHEHRQQKALLELAQRKKTSEAKQAIVRWLAETDELDANPVEFSEEIEEYYKNNGGEPARQRVMEAREKRRKEEEEKERERLLKKGYWMKPSNPLNSVLRPRSSTSTRFASSTPSHLRQVTTYSLGDVHRLENLPRVLSLQSELKDMPDISGLFANAGYGKINSGWRAPRLHKLIRPFKPFNIEEEPKDIVEDQKKDLEERREEYKKGQMEQRGDTPPKDMVERAMPKTAEPFLAGLPIPQTYTNPHYGIMPHPFIFPKKKYMVHTGVF